MLLRYGNYSRSDPFLGSVRDVNLHVRVGLGHKGTRATLRPLLVSRCVLPIPECIELLWEKLKSSARCRGKFSEGLKGELTSLLLRYPCFYHKCPEEVGASVEKHRGELDVAVWAYSKCFTTDLLRLHVGDEKGVVGILFPKPQLG